MATPVTLAQLRAALKTQLSTLLMTASPPGPFRSVVSFAGRASTAVGKIFPVQHAIAGNVPAVVIALDTEQGDGVGTIRTNARGLQRTVLESRWIVFVAIESAQENEADADDAASDSIDACTQAVQSALSGFRIVGLLPNTRVEIIETRPGEVLPGMLLHEVHVRARREIAAVAVTQSSSPVSLDVSQNLGGTSDDPNNPVVESVVVP